MTLILQKPPPHPIKRLTHADGGVWHNQTNLMASPASNPGKIHRT